MEFPSPLTIFLFILIMHFIFYKSCSAVKYYTKFVIYCVGFTIFATLFIPYFCFRPKNVENFLVFSQVFKYVTKILGIKWTLRGHEHIITNKTVIYVANHQSSLDILDIWEIIRLMTVVSKKELLYAGPFGIASYLAGAVFIDRKSEKGKDVMNKAMEKLKRENIKLWIFPEGTRRNTVEVHDFKKGAFHMAIQYEVPILPVVYSSYRHFLDDKLTMFEEGEIIIEALPEISTKGLTLNDIDSLIENVKKDMEVVYKKNTVEVVRTYQKKLV